MDSPARDAASLLLALLLVGWIPAGGTARAGEVAAPAGVLRLDDELRGHPPADGAPATVVEVARSARTSTNLWQTGQAMPAHLHREHEEVILFARGRMAVRIGDREVEVGPGDAIVVPPGTIHSGRTIEGPASGWSVFSPPFDGKDRVVADTAAPPGDHGRGTPPAAVDPGR